MATVIRPSAKPRPNPFLPVIPDEILASRNRSIRSFQVYAEAARQGLDLTPQNAALVPVIEEQAEAAARELARGSTAKIVPPPSPDELKAIKREVADLIARWRAAGAVPKPDHDAHRAAFQFAVWSGGPQAAWSVYADWCRSVVERFNAEQLRAELGATLGIAPPGIARRQLKPGDALHPIVVSGVPVWADEFQQAVARVPGPATEKGGR